MRIKQKLLFGGINDRDTATQYPLADYVGAKIYHFAGMVLPLYPSDSITDNAICVLSSNWGQNGGLDADGNYVLKASCPATVYTRQRYVGFVIPAGKNFATNDPVYLKLKKQTATNGEVLSFEIDSELNQVIYTQAEYESDDKNLVRIGRVNGFDTLLLKVDVECGAKNLTYQP